MAIVLPEERTEPTNLDPNTILLYAKPKQGKTTICSLLPNHLIIDTENGSGKVNARKYCIDITKPVHEQAQEFVEVCRAIYMKGYNTDTKVYTPFYDYIVIDTLSQLDIWSETVGTLEYMDRMQGKKFNRDEKGAKIKPTSKEFETVHSLPNGAGYASSRTVMMDWFNKICMLANRVIFVCHVKDKFVGNSLGEEVLTKEIALTGKLKDIIAARVDTVAFGYRDGNKFMMSFSSENDGTRTPHLSGKNIMITETNGDGKIIKNNWNMIFSDYVEEQVKVK